MIEYNENDFNTDRINAINFKLHGYKMKNPYWVYGLVQNNRPPIRIGVNDKGVPNEAQQKEITEFFKGQGCDVLVDHPEEAEVTIGLRYDIREKPRFAAAIVRTIIFYLEGKLDLAKDFKVKIPMKKKAKKATSKKGKK